MTSDTAFVYDFLLIAGGAETLALHVKRAFPEIDMVFGFINRETFPEELYPQADYRSLTSQSGIVGWQGIKVMTAFSRKAAFLQDYNSVIFSGSYAPLAVRHHPQGRNIYYCHALPRFVYDLKDYYLDQASSWQKPLLKGLIAYLKPRFEESMDKMDLILCNSGNVKGRIATYLGRSDAEVIHPPVATGQFSWMEQGDYYLSTARLEPYKRVEMIVRAFMKMPDKRLLVASGGSEYDRLRELAQSSPNIGFIGWCSDEQLCQLMGRCIATVYLPIDEDFGISPVESMAAGKPVIGVAEGGLLETVVPGETGILIEPALLETDSGTEAIMQAVNSMDEASAESMRTACELRARQFDLQHFNRKLRSVLSF